MSIKEEVSKYAKIFTNTELKTSDKSIDFNKLEYVKKDTYLYEDDNGLHVCIINGDIIIKIPSIPGRLTKEQIIKNILNNKN